MPIRRARYADIDPAARVLTAAFWDEDVVGNQMHPRRNDFPNDVLEWFRRRLKVEWWDWARTLSVATTKEGEVVGCCSWARWGKGTGLRWCDPRRLMHFFAATYYRVIDTLYPNRAANPAMLNIFSRAKPFYIHHWAGPRGTCYFLDRLGVAPDHQGQGYGTALVEWGLQRAAMEGIAASTVSSEGNEGFYRRCGFEEVVGNVCEGEGNPMEGFKGGAILFRDP